MRFFLFLLFWIPSALHAQHWGSDTVHLYFPMDQRTLPEGVKAQLDKLAYDGEFGIGSRIMIIGYADYVGGSGYNDKLSRDRANAVAQYLKAYGMTGDRVTIVIGKGEVDRPDMHGSQGNARDRRVDIVLRVPQDLPPVPAATPEPAPTPPPAPVIHKSAVQAITNLKANETLVLSNLYFYPGRHTLKPESIPVLDTLLQVLKSHPSLRLRVEGHICCITNAPDAMDFDSGDSRLSVNRARAVRTWLIEQGIAPARLTYQGFGRTRPIVQDERDEEEASKNRRVELRVISQ